MDALVVESSGVGVLPDISMNLTFIPEWSVWPSRVTDPLTLKVCPHAVLNRNSIRTVTVLAICFISCSSSGMIIFNISFID